MKLLGLDTSLPVYLEHTERGRQTVPAQSLQDGILMIDLDEASMYVSPCPTFVPYPCHTKSDSVLST
jgi:hypothetical protein